MHRTWKRSNPRTTRICLQEIKKTKANHNARTMTTQILEDSVMQLEIQNGIDVIDSLLLSSSALSISLTTYQKEGLNQLRKMLLLVTFLPTKGNTIATETSKGTSNLPQIRENGGEKSSNDEYDQRISSKFGILESSTDKRKNLGKVVQKNSFISRNHQRISQKVINNKLPDIDTALSRQQQMKGGLKKVKSDKNLYFNYAPPEWYKLDRKTQIQLFNHLSWENLMNWNFDVFEVSKLCNGQPLLFVGWAILASPRSQEIMEQTITSDATIYSKKNHDDNNDGKGYNFLETYKITSKCMIDFLRAIEDRYIAENAYHNNIHAADVLQTTHSFLEAMGGKYLGVEVPKPEEKKVPCQSPIMTLQTFSILVGAAIHDVGHPGFSNAFQSNSFSQAALTYNDISVLENFHVSSSFQMILGVNGNSDWNIFQGMERNDFVTCKKLITEAVLGTDLALHFSKLEDIKDLKPQGRRSSMKIQEKDSNVNNDTIFTSYSWKVMSFLMHMADICNTAKRRSTSVRWTNRLLSEFFKQGDKEKEMGLPISPLCDRDDTPLASSQLKFMNNFIRPSFEILKNHLPSIEEKILPIVEANYLQWEMDLQQEKRIKNDTNEVEGQELSNIVIPRAA